MWLSRAPTEEVFSPPYHPYTEALLSAVPIADTSIVKKHIVLEGDIPSAMNPPSGCPFQTRCRWKSRVPGNLCETEVPVMQEVQPGNCIKCHLAPEVLAEMEPVISQRKDGKKGREAFEWQNHQGQGAADEETGCKDYIRLDRRCPCGRRGSWCRGRNGRKGQESRCEQKRRLERPARPLRVLVQKGPQNRRQGFGQTCFQIR